MGYELDKISIIIPVFNVEKYIDKCLFSVVNQTYKKIEIIIIIDGSTDKSEKICRKYAENDKRIVLIKQENRGLSSARNRGIKSATGKYIMFVDGDDHVSPFFCEKPYEIALETNADLVIFGTTLISKCWIKKKTKAYSLDVDCIDKETAIDLGGVAAWNKLYSVELFMDVQYPEGKVFEDIATTHKLIFKSKKIIFINDRLYYHVYNPKSITKTKSYSYRRDGFIASINRFHDLISESYPYDKAFLFLFSSALAYLACVDPSNDYLYKAAVKITNTKNCPANCKPKIKILFFLWKNNANLFHLVCKLFGKRIL